MKHLKKQSSWQFKKNADGETVYYPWGMFAGGYVLKSAEQERKLRALVKWQWLILIVVFAASFLTESEASYQLWFLVFIALCHFLVLWVVKRFAVKPGRVPNKQVIKELAGDYSMGLLIIILLLGLLVILALAYELTVMLVSGGFDPGAITGFVFNVVIFGYCSYTALQMVLLKKKI